MKLTTGAVVRLLGTAEPRIQELIRRGKVTPPPDVVAGRRLWTPIQTRAVAEHLGVLTPEVEAAIDATFGEVQQEVAS